MADPPQTLVLRRHRDLEGRRREAWARRGLLCLVGLVPVLALFNVFGQRPQTARASTPAAALTVYAPTRVRAGLIYAARFRINARQELKDATLVFDPSWAESYTVNGLAPQPANESSRDGRLAYSFGQLAAGHSILFFLSLQVNPTNVGHRAQNVDLYDGETRLASIHRTVTIFP
ncbi:MAG: hypothetical protein ABI896_03375 [Actinomycetota bacterium]